MKNAGAVMDSRVQTIIWDLDGTLLDSFGIYQDCLNSALRKNGHPEASEHVLRHNHHGTLEDSIANVLRDMHQTVNEEQLAAIIKDFFVLDNAYIKDVDHHLYKDAIELAERLHRAGKQQIIVTNRAHGTDRQNASPRTMVQNSQRLGKLIDHILCGDDSEHRNCGDHAGHQPVPFGDVVRDPELGNGFGGRGLGRLRFFDAWRPVVQAQMLVHLALGAESKHASGALGDRERQHDRPPRNGGGDFLSALYDRADDRQRLGRRPAKSRRFSCRTSATIGGFGQAVNSDPSA